MEEALGLPSWLVSGRTSGTSETNGVLDARRMEPRRGGALGRYGVGAKSVRGLITGTGAGKRESALAAAMEIVSQGKRVTVVVKDRRELAEFEAAAEAAWSGLDVVPSGEPARSEFRLVPEPYAPTRLRARPAPVAEYQALCAKAGSWEVSGRDQERRVVRGDRRVRNPAARSAVLIRSGGRCENPECLLPDLPYRTSAGEPLLEVDHIDEHAGGGRDHPSAMIALCPNCHSNKTYGAERSVLTERLRETAAERHAAWATRVL
ncbi:HNH endonuclease [Streptomyces sp. NPDC008125]|uniref:HNH endonuclease n=1 Tax=Streptomyces sp. NPDC008125 TaxID=3364811 RepID=UPI0036EF7522